MGNHLNKFLEEIVLLQLSLNVPSIVLNVQFDIVIGPFCKFSKIKLCPFSKSFSPAILSKPGHRSSGFSGAPDNLNEILHDDVY